jgi:hypothetical protein
MANRSKTDKSESTLPPKSDFIDFPFKMPGILYNPFSEAETITVPDDDTFVEVVQSMTHTEKTLINQVEVIAHVPLPILSDPTTLLLQRECVRLEQELREQFDEALRTEGTFYSTTFDGYEMSSSSTIHHSIITIRLLIDVSIIPYSEDEEEDENEEDPVAMSTVDTEDLGPIQGDWLDVEVGGRVDRLPVVSSGYFVEVLYRGEVMLAEPCMDDDDLFELSFPEQFIDADAYVDFLKANPDADIEMIV